MKSNDLSGHAELVDRLNQKTSDDSESTESEELLITTLVNSLDEDMGKYLAYAEGGDEEDMVLYRSMIIDGMDALERYWSNGGQI